MASDKVINKWNVNIAVLDDVQLRFSTGDYKTEIELFGFLAVGDGSATAYVYEDEDACYKDYYFFNLEPNKYISTVQNQTYWGEGSGKISNDVYMQNFKEELLSNEMVISLLKIIEEKMKKKSNSLFIDNYPEIMLDYSMIDYLLERKIRLDGQFDYGEYLKMRETTYDEGVYCVVYTANENTAIFFDKRNANLVKKRNLFNLLGYQNSGLKYLNNDKSKNLYQLKNENFQKINEIKLQWEKRQANLKKLKCASIFLPKEDIQDAFYEETFNKYKFLLNIV